MKLAENEFPHFERPAAASELDDLIFKAEIIIYFLLSIKCHPVAQKKSF